MLNIRILLTLPVLLQNITILLSYTVLVQKATILLSQIVPLQIPKVHDTVIINSDNADRHEISVAYSNTAVDKIILFQLVTMQIITILLSNPVHCRKSRYHYFSKFHCRTPQYCCLK